MPSFMTSIIEILTGGLTSIGEAVGTSLSNMATSIFLTGTGETQALSVFGTLIVVFAGISLGLSLTRWVLNFVTSFGNRNR